MKKNPPQQQTQQTAVAVQKAEKLGNIFDVFVKEMFGRISVFVTFLQYYANPELIAKLDLKNDRRLRGGIWRSLVADA